MKFKLYILYYLLIICFSFQYNVALSQNKDMAKPENFAPASDGSDVPERYRKSVGMTDPKAAHDELLSENSYPSAIECGRCHPKVFTEWASSNHAYASISPMFHKFEQAVNDLTSGTIGSFCVRCHQQVGTQRG